MFVITLTPVNSIYCGSNPSSVATIAIKMFREGVTELNTIARNDSEHAMLITSTSVAANGADEVAGSSPSRFKAKESMAPATVSQSTMPTNEIPTVRANRNEQQLEKPILPAVAV
jgi:hypothetical protein